MTKATVAKLAVLIILTFIVCLPEFFPPEVLQVRFRCVPFDPCDPNSGRDHNDGQVYEMYNAAGITPPRCEAKNASSQDAAVKEWFVCETHADLQRLCDNASISEVATEVIVTLHVTAPPLLQNVTVNGHFNRSGLHVDSRPNITLFGCRVQSDGTPQPSDSNRSSVSHKPNTLEPGVFSAGSPASSEGPNSNTDHTHQPNRSHCLFHLKDVRRTSSKTAGRWSLSTVVWLLLVLLVVILVFLGVRDQVFKNRSCCQRKVKAVLRPPNQPKTFFKRRVKSLGDLPDDVSAISIEDKDLFLEKTPSDYSRGHVTSHQRKVSLTSTKRFLQAFQESYKRGLSPIPELSMTDVSLGEDKDMYDEETTSDGVITEEESEVCLDVPLTPGNTHSEHFTFLHHRSISPVESCHWPKSPGGRDIKRCPTL